MPICREKVAASKKKEKRNSQQSLVHVERMKQRGKKNGDSPLQKCNKRRRCALVQSFNLKNTDLKNVKVSEALFVHFVQYRVVSCLDAFYTIYKTFIRINFPLFFLSAYTTHIHTHSNQLVLRLWWESEVYCIGKTLFIIIVNLKSLEFCYAIYVCVCWAQWMWNEMRAPDGTIVGNGKSRWVTRTKR